jgi:hypothetical protein
MERRPNFLRQHAATLVNGGALAVALGVSSLVPFARLPGPLTLGLLVLGLLFLPARSSAERRSPARELLAQLRTQAIIVAGAIVAGRLLLGEPWTAFWFVPPWSLTVVLVWFLRTAPLHRLLEFSGTVARSACWCGERVAQLVRWRLGERDEIALTGALLVAAATALALRLAPAGLAGPSGIAPWAVGALWLVLDRLPARWQDGATPRARGRRLAWRMATWTILGTTAALAGLPGVTGRGVVAWLLAANALLGLFAAGHIKAIKPAVHNVALLGLGIGVAILIHPFATPHTLGSGDAIWYANTLADALAQLRAGVFPVFVGQSEFLFNGGVFPIRFAPLFQHYGMLLDLLTLRTLEAGSLQNLIIIGAFALGGLNAYRVSRRLHPERPGFAAALALLYLSCPGVLVLVYGNDLLMTWSTLPWLPLAFGGCARSFVERGREPLIQMALGLGLLWWGHPPVALWSTALIGAVQLARLAPWWLAREQLVGLAAAALVFALLAAYPLISVLAVPIETGQAPLDNPTGADTIALFARQAFPGILMPLLTKARDLADFQPGWALLLVLAAAVGLAVRQRAGRSAWCLLAVPLVLLLLLLPANKFCEALWQAIPDALRNPTGNWPMQRFYVIIAISTVTAFAAVSRQLGPRGARAATWLAVLGAGWAAIDAGVLRRGTEIQLHALRAAPSLRLPENNLLTRYAYLGFARRPAYYSHGHVTPMLEQRLLDRTTRAVLVSNAAAAASPATGRELARGTLVGRPLPGGLNWELTPRFRLEPRRHYLLEFDFAAPMTRGVLAVTGHTLNRIYEFPMHGDRLSFGAGPDASRLLSLFTRSDQAGEVTLNFIDSADPARDAGDSWTFARYRWIEYSPEQLPIQVTNWIPYEATVHSPAPAWLETSRVFQTGFRANVDGQPVDIAKSPEGLIMVPVPAGESRVRLSYHPAGLLLAGYLLSVTTLLALAILASREGWAGERGAAPGPASPPSPP